MNNYTRAIPEYVVTMLRLRRTLARQATLLGRPALHTASNAAQLAALEAEARRRGIEVAR